VERSISSAGVPADNHCMPDTVVVYNIGSDNKVFVWNVGMGEVLCEIDFPDIPLSCSWNYDGSRFAVACKDHKVRIVDPRNGKFIRVGRLLCVFLGSAPFCLIPFRLNPICLILIPNIR